MPNDVTIDVRPYAKSKATTLVGVVIVAAVLRIAREMFIPFALACLLSFLLAPLALRLRHWHFGRVPSVLCVVLMAFIAMAVLGGFVAVQLSDLAGKLPQYRQNIQEK